MANDTARAVSTNYGNDAAAKQLDHEADACTRPEISKRTGGQR